MLLLKRMRQRAVVFVALLVVTAVVSGLAVGILGFLGAAESDGVRSQLTHRSGGDVALELSLASEADGASQAARVDALLARIFRNGDRVIPVAVTNSLVSSNPVQLSLGVKAFVASIPELESNADLVTGAWPSAAREASVQADAAESLGLAPGDVLGVGDATVTVTGTWRLSDPLDPRWVSDPLLLEGLDGAVLGPIVVAEGDLAAVGATTDTHYAIVPAVASLEPGDLDIVIEGWRTIADSMRADGGFRVDSLELSGRFASTATSIQSIVDALGAVAPVALLIIAAIAALTLVELGRLLGTVRSAEFLLLWSRGDTVLALATVAAVEAAVVSVAGATLGTTAGVLAVGLPLEQLGIAVWAVPAVTTLVATLVFAATTGSAARSMARNYGPEDGGRAARVTSVAAPIFLVIAAALSTWQLLIYGSPLTPARDGGTQLDPIAVLAPALVLLALVALALAAVPLAALPLDRAAARSTGRALVLRTLARRTRLLAAPLVLCALAAGQVTLAAGYAQTWDTAYSTTAALRSGSDFTATGTRDPLTEGVFTGIADTPGVSAVAPVYSEQVVVGETPASMIAATPAAIIALASPAGGIFDATAAAEAVAAPLNVPKIPAGTHEVAVTTTSNSDLPAELTLVVADELGVQHEILATETYTAELPAGTGEWRLLAVIVRLTTGGPTSLSITGITADGAGIELGDGWSAVGFDPLLTEVTPAPLGAGFRAADGLLSVRLAPLFGTLTDDIQPRVLVSNELAEAARIRVGDILPIALDARMPAFNCVIAGIIPAVPGASSESAVLVDGSIIEAARARVYNETPTPQVAWIGATDPAGVLPDVREAVPAGVIVSALAADADRGILASAATALWLGALGAGILAIVALIAVVGAQLRSRRGEVFVLRALGVSGRELAGGRRAELGAVIGVGVIVGVLAGAVVTALTIPALARAAVPGSYDSLATAVGFQPFGLALGLGTLVAASAVVVLAYGRRVAR